MLSLTTEAEVSDRLNTLNLPAKKIDVLLEAWELEKYDAQKIPTKSELAKLMKLEIIDEETYRIEMKKLNYVDKYIDWYLLQIAAMTRKEINNVT